MAEFIHSVLAAVHVSQSTNGGSAHEVLQRKRPRLNRLVRFLRTSMLQRLGVSDDPCHACDGSGHCQSRSATSALYRAATKHRLATRAGFAKAFAALEATRKKYVDARDALISHKDLLGC